MVRLTLDPQGQDLLSPSDASRAAAERLEALLPADASLWEDGESGSDDLSLADCILRLALALQREFGDHPRHRAVLPHTKAGRIEVVYGYVDPAMGARIGQFAVELTAQAAALGAPVASASADGLSDTFNRLMQQLQQVALRPSTRRSVWEAQRRGIPWRRITHSVDTVQLGQGHKQRRLRGTYTQSTSYLAVRIALSKFASAELLRSNGIPMPRHLLVHSADSAVAAAEAIGYPVVVKPNERDMGTAVSIDLTDAAKVRAAFAVARPYGPALVEKQIVGVDYRITVLHGSVVAAARNIAAYVTGDGEQSIQDLIDRINRDPRRSMRYYSPLTEIRPDAHIRRVLAGQGYDLESVPPAGQEVALRHWWREASDHTAEDLTDRIHPANRSMIERAVRLVGLDLSGVDYITPDITRPWFEVGGAINEINPTPGLKAHIRAGAPDVHRIIVEDLFPPGDDGRIPLAAIATAPAAPTIVGLVARLLEALGHCPATATARGVDIAGQAVSRRPATDVAGAEMAFGDPLTTAAVLEICDTTAEAEGLGFDRASVVALMQAPRSEAVARLLLHCARDFVVLDADLPAVAELADSSGAKRVLWVTRAPRSDRVVSHVKAGGAAVVLDEVAGDPDVLLWDAGDCHRLCRFGELAAEPDLGDGNGVLFAVAIAYGLTRSAREIACCLGSNQDRYFSAERT